MLVRGTFTLTDTLPLAVWLLCAGIGHVVLRRALPDHDPILFPLAMFLSGWGLMMIERLAPNFGERQTVWLAVAVIGMLLAASMRRILDVLRDFRYTILLASIGLLVITIVFGTNPSGTQARRNCG